MVKWNKIIKNGKWNLYLTKKNTINNSHGMKWNDEINS
jgi:hypothetical protein